MNDGKPGTDLVPVTSRMKTLPLDVLGVGSLAARRLGDLARIAETLPPEPAGGTDANPSQVRDVDQSRSRVQGDQVAGDKVAGAKITGDVIEPNAIKIERQFNVNLPRTATVVEKMLTKLEHEMEHDIQISDTITRLQRYHGGVNRDGVTGLVAKLEKGGRYTEIEAALEQKEDFAKLLEAWSLYHSAQEIFVHLLARAEHTYNSEIMPDLDHRTITETNRLINAAIVTPMVEDLGVSVLRLDHVSAMGMLYWLAEQCFIRWH